MLLKLGRLDEALAAYDQAIARKQIPGAFLGRAVIRARKGDMARARADRAEAIRRAPQVEELFAEYGVKL